MIVIHGQRCFSRCRVAEVISRCLDIVGVVLVAAAVVGVIVVIVVVVILLLVLL